MFSICFLLWAMKSYMNTLFCAKVRRRFGYFTCFSCWFNKAGLSWKEVTWRVSCTNQSLATFKTKMLLVYVASTVPVFDIFFALLAQPNDSFNYGSCSRSHEYFVMEKHFRGVIMFFRGFNTCTPSSYIPWGKSEAPLLPRRPPHPGKAAADGPPPRSPQTEGPNHLRTQNDSKWINLFFFLFYLFPQMISCSNS